MTEFKYCIYCGENTEPVCFGAEADAMKFAREETNNCGSVRVEKIEIDENGDIVSSEVIWEATINAEEPEENLVKDNPFAIDFPKSDIEDITISDDADYAEIAKQYEETPEYPADADDFEGNRGRPDWKKIKEAIEENESEVECTCCFDLFPKEDCVKTDKGYVCKKCNQEIHSHQGTNLDLIDNDPFSLDYEDPRDPEEEEEPEVKEEPVDANEVRKFEAGIEENLNEEVSDEFKLNKILPQYIRKIVLAADYRKLDNVLANDDNALNAYELLNELIDKFEWVYKDKHDTEALIVRDVAEKLYDIRNTPGSKIPSDKSLNEFIVDEIKSHFVTIDGEVVEKLEESQSQEIGDTYKKLSKLYNVDMEELVYGDDGFMKSRYPEGFPDFAGDVIYSEKYWTEFEKWLKETKGIVLDDNGIKDLSKVSIEEHINDRPADIESDQELQGADNAVVDCEVAKVIAHSEDEKPLDCKMEKPALEKPLAGEKVDVKVNEDLSEEEAKELDKEVETLEEEVIYGLYINKEEKPAEVGSRQEMMEKKKHLDDVSPNNKYTVKKIGNTSWESLDKGNKKLKEVVENKKRLTVIIPDYQYEDEDGSVYTLYGDELEEDNTGIVYNWSYAEDDSGDIYIFENLQETKDNKIKLYGRDLPNTLIDDDEWIIIDEKDKELAIELDKKVGELFKAQVDKGEVDSDFYNVAEFEKLADEAGLEWEFGATNLQTENLEEAKKDDELPVDPEAAKLEVHTMLNDLVADEIEAINGYEEAKKEILDAPISHKDTILDTVDHIEDEEKEHVDELVDATKEIPFGKEEAPVVEEPAEEPLNQDFPEIEEKLTEDTVSKEELEQVVEALKKDLENCAWLDEYLIKYFGTDDKEYWWNNWNEKNFKLAGEKIYHWDKKFINQLVKAFYAYYNIYYRYYTNLERLNNYKTESLDTLEERSMMDIPFDSDVKEGDKIRIIHLVGNDTAYDNKEGIVERIDGIGQLHGTWGDPVIIPGVDEFEVITESLKESLDASKLQKLDEYVKANGLEYEGEYTDKGHGPRYYVDEISYYIEYKNNKYELTMSVYHSSEDNNAEYPERHTDEIEEVYDTAAELYEAYPDIVEAIYGLNEDEINGVKECLHEDAKDDAEIDAIIKGW